MNLFDCIIIFTKCILLSHIRRQIIVKHIFFRKRLTYRLDHKIVRYASGQRIHGEKHIFHLCISLRLIDDRLFHHIFTFFDRDFSIEDIILIGFQIISDIWLPIPDQLHLMSDRTNGKQCQLHTPRTFDNRRCSHLCYNRMIFFREGRNLIDRFHLRIPDICPGKMKEYITNGVYSHFCKQFFCFLPNSF